MKGVFVVGADGALGRLLVSALGATGVTFRHPGETLSGRVPEIAAARVVVNVSGPRVWPGLGWTDYLREHVGTASAVGRSMSAGSHLVHVSSAAVYGAQPGAPIGARTPEAPTSFPNPPYAWAKLAGEHAVRAIGRERGVQVSVLRPTMVYGSGVSSALDTLLSLASRGVVLDLLPGHVRQCGVHVSLLAAVVERLATGKTLSEPLPVADPFSFTNAELSRAVAARHGGLKLPIPLGVAEAVLRRWPLFPARDAPGALAALAVLGLGNVFDAAPILAATGLDAGDFTRARTLDAYLGGAS